MAMRVRDSLSRNPPWVISQPPPRKVTGKKIRNEFPSAAAFWGHLAVTDASRAESLPGTR